MNLKELWAARGPKLMRRLERYRWILLVIAVGTLFLLLPTGGKEAKEAAKGQDQSVSDFNLEETEQRFSKALSEIRGAGDVTVLLTVKSGARQIIAENNKLSEASSGFGEESSAVLISRGSGVQETVKLQEIYPQFQGALIICDGAGDPEVRLKLTQATAALTGLGADKISICSRGK